MIYDMGTSCHCNVPFFVFFALFAKKKFTSFNTLSSFSFIFPFFLFLFLFMLFFKTDLRLLSLNARGLRDNLKRKAVFLFCKSKNPHCVLLQETHSNNDEEKFWTNQWGDKVMFSHSTNCSAGTAVLLNNLTAKVLTVRKGADGHWLVCVLYSESTLILANIYGYNNQNQNKKLLSEITQGLKELHVTYPTSSIFMGGDFNMVFNEWLDRSPTKAQTHCFNPQLKSLVIISV